MNNTGIKYLSTERTPTVLPELAELLPPLSDEQLSVLEADILQNGCYSPVIVNEELMIVDGHNRFNICEKHGLPYRMAVFHFEDMLEAKQWAVDNQKGRRNLNMWELGQIALKLKPHIEARAAQSHAANGGDKKSDAAKSASVISPKPVSENIDTRKELAKAIGIGEKAMGQIMQIDGHAPDAIKKSLENKEISVNKGYELTKKLQELPEDQQEAAAATILEAEKAYKEKNAQIDHKGRVARQICTAFEKSFLMQPTEENIRIWIDYAGIRSDMVDSMIGQAEELSARYAAFAGILKKIKLTDWRIADETAPDDTPESQG